MTTNHMFADHRDYASSVLCRKIITLATECIHIMVDMPSKLYELMPLVEDPFFKEKIEHLNGYITGYLTQVVRLKEWAGHSLELGYPLQEEMVSEAHAMASETKNLAFTMVVLRKAIAERSEVLNNNDFIKSGLDINYVKMLEIVVLLRGDEGE